MKLDNFRNSDNYLHLNFYNLKTYRPMIHSAFFRCFISRMQVQSKLQANKSIPVD